MKHISSRFALEEPVISVFYLSVFQEVVQARGFELLGCNNVLSKLSDHHHRISPKHYLDVLCQTVSSHSMPGIGFDFGAHLTLAGAGPLGQLLMSSENLQEAMEHFLEFYPLLSLSMDFESTMETRSLDITMQHMYQQQDPEVFK